MPNAYPEPLSIEQHHPSLSLPADLIKRGVHQVLDAEGATLKHLSIVLSDHDTVRSLNREYLDHDYNTDVLSFSLRNPDAENPRGMEGELYIDLDTAAERHDEFSTTFEREALRYVVHGLLHLLGYDDATDDGQDTMRSKENEYLDATFAA